jgi:NADH-quinone oxidoreductase subunit J
MDFLVAHFAEIIFYLLAAAAVAGGIGVISFKNPVHSALSLLWTFLVVAALFILRHAEFLAAVQVMVYAGGIMVLFLFVIMLTNVKKLQAERVFLSQLAPVAVMGGILLGALIMAAILLGTLATVDSADPAIALQTVVDHGAEPEVVGNTEAVGNLLYRTYLVPFEVVSVVLLVAMVAAIIFGRKDPSLEVAKGGAER